MTTRKKEEAGKGINVFSNEIIEFATVAESFCKFTENTTDYTKQEFLEKGSKILSLLYMKGFSLPTEDVENFIENSLFVTESDWNFVQETISTKLGKNEIYVDFYEPENLNETINISLSEAFADIYQDIKDFIEIYKIGNIESSESAIVECRDNFEFHWGPRALLCISEIHNILFSGESLDDDDNDSSESDPDIPHDRWVNHMFN